MVKITIPYLLSTSERERIVDSLVAALEKDAGKKLDPEWTRGFARQFMVCFGVMFDNPAKLGLRNPNDDR